eukprot:582783-Heterocapsa_arctica.AAC.1
MLREWQWDSPGGSPQVSIQRLILCGAAGPVAYWQTITDGAVPDVRLIQCPGDKLCPIDLEVPGSPLDRIQVTQVQAAHPRLLPGMIGASLHRYGHLLSAPAILSSDPPPAVL